jgi:hypothetical protein
MTTGLLCNGTAAVHVTICECACATIFPGGMPLFMAVWGGFLAVLGRTRVSDDKPPGARNEFTNGCNARLGKQKVLPMLSTTYD